METERLLGHSGVTMRFWMWSLRMRKATEEITWDNSSFGATASYSSKRWNVWTKQSTTKIATTNFNIQCTQRNSKGYDCDWFYYDRLLFITLPSAIRSQYRAHSVGFCFADVAPPAKRLEIASFRGSRLHRRARVRGWHIRQVFVGGSIGYTTCKPWTRFRELWHRKQFWRMSYRFSSSTVEGLLLVC